VIYNYANLKQQCYKYTVYKPNEDKNGQLPLPCIFISSRRQ